MVDVADRLAGDSTEDVDLVALLDHHAEAWYQQFHAPIVGEIQTYDKATQSADVRPIVLMYVEGEPLTTVPVLRAVPVAFPGGALTSYTWPLAAGDKVELVPQDADIGAYVASGSVNQLPQSRRRFSLSDAVAFPMYTRSRASPLPATAVADDGAVLAGLHYVGSSAATDFAAMAQKVLNELQQIKTDYDGHTHTAPAGGGLTTTPTNPMTAPSSVASTKLKVE